MPLIITLSMLLCAFIFACVLYASGYKREAIELKNNIKNFIFGYIILIFILTL